MRLTIEPTEAFFMAGDVMVRAWQGTLDDGRPVTALVSALVFDGDTAPPAGLVSIPPPRREDALQWALAVLDPLAGGRPR